LTHAALDEYFDHRERAHGFARSWIVPDALLTKVRHVLLGAAPAHSGTRGDAPPSRTTRSLPPAFAA